MDPKQRKHYLLFILGDAIVLLSKLPLTNKMGKSLVMSDYNQLEVLLPFPGFHYSEREIYILLQTQPDGRLVTVRYCCLKEYLNRAAARLSAFGPSRFVVGSSKANMPQFRQKVSASASLIISEART
jgi:hypothetical protein